MKDTKNDFKFYYFGKNATLMSGEISVKNPHKIYVGDNCRILKNVEMTVNDMSNDIFEYNLKLGSNSFINSASKIEAKNYIEIGNNVSIGPQVYISDMEHHYENFRIPIKQQGIKDKANKVIIKDGTWIGSGVKIIGNIKIGYGCVVGANSVVKSDIPDHCVVVGAPAKIIKICNYKTDEWIKIGENIEELNMILKNRGNFFGYNYYKLETMRSKSNNKENNKSKNTKIYKVELFEIFTMKFESILNDLYDVTTVAYDGNMELAFEKVVTMADEIENLFSKIIKSSNVKVTYENYIIKFNECLKLTIKAYENKNNEIFVMTLENELIDLIKNIKGQLEIAESDVVG